MLQFNTESEVLKYASNVVLNHVMKNPITLESADEAKEYLRLHKTTLRHEEFTVLFLDPRGRLIAAEDMFVGGSTRVSVDFRVLIGEVIKRNASAIIVSHNHPGTDATPSDADIEMTHSLAQGLKYVECELLDHFVVGEGGQIVSIKEHLKEIRRKDRSGSFLRHFSGDNEKMDQKVLDRMPPELREIMEKLGGLKDVKVVLTDGEESDTRRARKAGKKDELNDK